MAQDPVFLPFDGGSTVDGVRSSRPVRDTGDDDHAGRLTTFSSRALLVIAVMTLLVATGLFALRNTYSGRVYPSVFVADVPVGGLSYVEAKDTVQRHADSLLGTRLTFTYGDTTWSPTLKELGVSADTSGSIAEAFTIGREAGARDRVESTLDLVNGERSVPLLMSIDDAEFNAWVDSIETQLQDPAQDAYLFIKNGKVKVVEDVDGTAVDRVAARRMLEQSLLTSVPYTGALPVEIRPALIQTEHLQSARATLEAALSASVRMSYGKERWKLLPKEMSQFVVISVDRNVDPSQALTVTVDQEKLAGYLSALLKDEIDHDPSDATIAWSYEKNRVVATTPSVDGAVLKPITLARDVVQAFFSDERTVKIPTTVIEPEIDSNNLGALGITTRLGVGDSNFAGSEGGRATNVIVGAGLLNGTLVPPRGEFSFNRSIGEIRAELGYVEAGVVAGERIGKDIGGGICQVSTTVFRAAFFAGLPIEEWNPHRYRLGFYESDGYGPGLDASILQPEGDPFNGGDFRFSNPSDSWMLIESYVDGERVYVTIFGADLGYDVQISDPWFGDQEYPPTDDIELIDYDLPEGTVQQSEYAGEGMDVFYQRTVFDKNGDLLWDREFGTHFYPRGNVFKVSPDMQGRSPASQQGD